MKTCKDCICCNVCTQDILATDLHPYIDFSIRNDVEETCDDFKDKSKFIELPCSIGDDIWIIMCYEGKPLGVITQDKVQMIGITSRGIHIKARNHHEHNKMYMLGKTVFLTREEAEKKLEELK